MRNEVTEKIAEKLEKFNLPAYEMIPDVGLYLEQTVQYINDCFSHVPGMEITGSMISNYVKQGVVSKSIKKRYYREHIVRLIFLVVAKSVLSLDNIRLMFQMHEEVYEDHVAYEYLRREIANVGAYVFGLKDEMEEIGVTQSAAKTVLRKTIISFVHKIYVDMYLEIERERRG
ncbi:MAG: DUF1836 domain-containing protein [Erysipelotrichaceae bacterium]|nr:DUF1836 domain-containing protein [Erysipelotrichaceae bacterium]MBQ7888454.1 DUF1836 domain-containing protein [Erysipelotrichaceae bacterium]